jgi:hypothetical protein
MQWSLPLLLPIVQEVGILFEVGFELLLYKLLLIEMGRIDRQGVEKKLIALPIFSELELQLSLNSSATSNGQCS